ncbi:glycosyltransferase family 1 protein [Beijerinckia sp. L45]|uniref:glycosyltransferase family 4 protein n=1 Tax=Beijerinckia sp. L45 TaxID=1641855 RepID=UPI00131ABE4D|nr:glycosyltransferase family 1 protein [Beijerinckia sp. L45]
MERPVCYDVTRLLTRVLNATPNGIDRIDFALARHFLTQIEGARFGTTSTGFGSRLLDQVAARDAIDGIAAHWGEAAPGHDDPVYRAVVARITGASIASEPRPNQKSHRASTLRADVANGLRWLSRHGVPLSKNPQTDLPQGSVYINASQFPLWVAGSFEWLEARPDIKAAFFIHDLLPISMPEYFRAAEFERHRKRMANFARFGAAALVTTQTVANDLRAHVASLGRADVPIFFAPTPVAPIFSEPRQIDPTLDGHPFFVLCSTIEPRKNHLMILAAWRDLVHRYGRSAPKLVLVGTRGWKNELIIDLFERSPPLRDHVIAVTGLSTPGLKRLMDNAQAVLMPSFAEGYGLPVHEALAAGAPVIASDIPVFREIDAAGVTLLSPLDGEAWLEAVHLRAQSGRPAGDPAAGRVRATAGWSAYFDALDAFATAL